MITRLSYFAIFAISFFFFVIHPGFMLSSNEIFVTSCVFPTKRLMSPPIISIS